MSYEQTISDVVTVVEAAGAAIMVVGALLAFAVAARQAWPGARDPARGVRAAAAATSGASILLGLEVLIVGDIVRTIIVDPTVGSVVVLGLIVVIRIRCSFSLEVEIDGQWPWNRWRHERAEPPA